MQRGVAFIYYSDRRLRPPGADEAHNLVRHGRMPHADHADAARRQVALQPGIELGGRHHFQRHPLTLAGYDGIAALAEPGVYPDVRLRRHAVPISATR